MIQNRIRLKALNYAKKFIFGPVIAFFFIVTGLNNKYKILNTNAYAIGHLCVDIDCFLKESFIYNFKFRGVLLADRNRCANSFLCKIWARNTRLLIIESPFLCCLLDYLRTYPKTSFDCSKYCALDHQPAEVYKVYKTYGYYHSVISWDKHLHNEASQLFNREFPGVDISKVVVLHSRDSVYDQTVKNENMNTQKYRNSSAESFISIVDFLNSMNYSVIRIGKYESAEQIPNIKTIKSAQLSHYEEQVLDVYLSSSCALFIGSASGASNLAAIWNVPIFLLNILPYALLRPHTRNSMAIPKLLKTNGRTLGANYVFENKFHWFRDDKKYDANGLDIVINKPEDCIDDFKDFFKAFVEKDPGMYEELKNSEVQVAYNDICPTDSYDYYASSFVPRHFFKKYNLVNNL